MQPLSFDSHDVAEVEAFVSAMYSPTRIGATGECTHTRITRRVLTPEVAFDDLEYSYDVGFEAEPLGYFVLCNVVSDSVSYLSGAGGDERFGPGDSFLICRPELPYAGVVHAARLRQLTIDPAVLSQLASSTAGDAEPVQVLDHRPVSNQAALNLQRAMAYVRDQVMAMPEPRSQLVVSAASQYLAARLLDTFPNTAIDTPTAADRRDANPTALRRAVSFIETNPDLDLNLTDIARVAYVSPRALQLAFRRHLSTTPMGYLRRVRLDRAHAELQTASPEDGTTVTAVAARWGFSGPSRFAADYRAAYGQHPHRTLRDTG